MSTRTRYQSGSLSRVPRAKGPDVWVFRWRERLSDGTKVPRKKIVGDVKQFRTLSEAERATDNLRAEINAKQQPVVMTVETAWGHFQAEELSDPDVDRSPTTIQCYKDNFKNHIIPEWGSKAITDVRTVAVEKWLRSLTKLAPGTRAKIRNHMSSLFNHCIRQEWITTNPIKAVRTSSKRLREPDVLTVTEMQEILSRIAPQAIRVMAMTTAASALRRSEVRGLKWKDLDFDGLWFRLQRGVVRKMVTKMKTEASRRGLPMLPELADVLRQWRDETPYPEDDHWVFASPSTEGKFPYWPESALKTHIRPAATAAKIEKHIGWHTFRHSLGTLLSTNKEDLKIIQELLRHASGRITNDIYLHGDTDAKRSALSRMSGLFVVPKTKTA